VKSKTANRKFLLCIFFAVVLLLISCPSRESPDKAALEFFEATLSRDPAAIKYRSTARLFYDMFAGDSSNMLQLDLVRSVETPEDLSKIIKASRKAVEFRIVEEHAYTAKVRFTVNTKTSGSIIVHTYNGSLINFLTLLTGYDGTIFSLIKDEEIWTVADLLSPEYSMEYYERGKQFFANNEYQRSILDFNKAIEINPDFAEAYLYRGLAYGVMKKYNDAITDFDEAILIDPNLAEAYYARGVTYAWKGDRVKANQDASAAVRIRPNFDFTSAYLYRGTEYARRNIVR
jgi:hypothetical protein